MQEELASIEWGNPPSRGYKAEVNWRISPDFGLCIVRPIICHISKRPKHINRNGSLVFNSKKIPKLDRDSANYCVYTVKYRWRGAGPLIPPRNAHEFPFIGIFR